MWIFFIYFLGIKLIFMPIDFLFFFFILRKRWLSDRLNNKVNRIIPTFYLHLFCIYFLRLTERTCLFTLSFQVLDSNVFTFVNLIRILFFLLQNIEYSSCEKIFDPQSVKKLRSIKAVKIDR